MPDIPADVRTAADIRIQQNEVEKEGKIMLAEGTKAPAFELPDQNGKIHTLEEYRGRKVILYFYPKDNTAGCTRQACGFAERYPQFLEKGVLPQLSVLVTWHINKLCSQQFFVTTSIHGTFYHFQFTVCTLNETIRKWACYSIFHGR